MSDRKMVVSSSSSSVRMGLPADTDTKRVGPSASPRGNHSSSISDALSIGSREREHSPSGALSASSNRMTTGVVTSRVKLASSLATMHSALKLKAGAPSSATSSLSTGSLLKGSVIETHDVAPAGRPRAAMTVT
eukprot:scaffold7984_cov112-Isochrysis_galbana.AAC.1